MNGIKRFFRQNAYWIAGAILGFAAFLFVYGPEPLRVTSIGWTQQGFYGQDIRQHQAGWMFYRNSPWSFPLCKALNLGYPEGTSVSYTDSIPIAALFFKLLSPVLPKSFQYFGIYTCFCFMMQGLFGAALVYRFTKHQLYSALSSLLFVISSCFLERCFRHTALSSHWLLLAALFLYFARKAACGEKYRLLYWTVLLCLAVGIHPYLFGMVYGVFIVSGLKALTDRRSVKFTIFGILFGTGIVLLFGYVIGLFGTGVRADEGFGIYSLNLNGLFNPKSREHPVWSLFLPNRPVYGNQGDGIYYMGAGLLLTFAAVMIRLLIRERGALSRWIRSNLLLLALLAGCTLFAVSNVVTFDDKLLLTVPLPEGFYRIINIFRSSERFFFLPYYCIILTAAAGLYRMLSGNSRAALVCCLVLCGLQTADILPGLKDLRGYFEIPREEAVFTGDWDVLADHYNTAMTFDRNADYRLGFWLAKNHFRTNVMLSAMVHRLDFWARTEEERAAAKAALAEGSLATDPKTVWIIADKLDYDPSFESHEELMAYLDQVRKAYEGQAVLQFMTVNPVGDYWVLVPER